VTNAKVLSDNYPPIVIDGTRFHYGREPNHGRYLVEHETDATNSKSFNRRADLMAFLVCLPASVDSRLAADTKRLRAVAEAKIATGTAQAFNTDLDGRAGPHAPQRLHSDSARMTEKLPEALKPSLAEAECIGSVSDRRLLVRVFARKGSDGFHYFAEPRKLAGTTYGGAKPVGHFAEANFSRLKELFDDAKRLIDDHRQSQRLQSGQRENQGPGFIERVVTDIKSKLPSGDPPFLDISDIARPIGGLGLPVKASRELYQDLARNKLAGFKEVFDAVHAQIKARGGLEKIVGESILLRPEVRMRIDRTGQNSLELKLMKPFEGQREELRQERADNQGKNQTREPKLTR
jgi:hypothetical protein